MKRDTRHESIGVVTFSSVQQNLIDDMLVDAFAEHPDIADFDARVRRTRIHKES